MATLESIASAMKQIDTKRDDLKKAYDDLQSHSSLLSSFSLSWSDLDAHFTHIQTSLTHRFRLLQSLQSPPPDSSLTAHSDLPSHSPVKDPPLSNPSSHNPVNSPSTQPLATPVPYPSSSNQPNHDRVESTQRQSKSCPAFVDTAVARSELWTLCEKMDGRGLVKYINDHSKERDSIRVELAGAIRAAPNPGMMVLDAVEGFYGANNGVRGDNDPDRRTCVLLLEVLLGVDVNIGTEVKERAKRLAFEWKGKVRVDGERTLEALGFLHLVATYGLGSEFEKNDLVEYLLFVARYRQGTLLCKAVGLADKVQGMMMMTERFKVDVIFVMCTHLNVL